MVRKLKLREVEYLALGHARKWQKQNSNPETAWFQSLCSESLPYTAPDCCFVNLDYVPLPDHLPLPQPSKAGNLIPFTDKFVAVRVNFLNLTLPPSQICLPFCSSSLHPSISRKGHPSSCLKLVF